MHGRPGNDRRGRIQDDVAVAKGERGDELLERIGRIEP